MTNPGISSELLGCPFCDGAVLVTGWEMWAATCNDCGARTSGHADRESAIEAWNTRATPAAEIVRLREAAPDAVDMLEHYAEYIRGVPVSEIERHPYLPEVERIIEELRAALTQSDTVDKVNQ